jgi:hypothetical protein
VGFVARCRDVTIVGAETLSMTPTALQEMNGALSAAGGVIEDPATSAQMTVAVGDLCEEDGTAVTDLSSVVCSITPLDVSSDETENPGNNISLAPGNFRGLALSGVTGQIGTGGMMDIVCKDAEENELYICAGRQITIRIPIYGQCTDESLYPPTMPSWGFAEATGLWKQLGGNFAKSACGGGGAADNYYEGPISHLSWWNADYQYQATCLTGKVEDAGQPVSGALITCEGLDYLGRSEAYTDSNGSFCVEVKAGTDFSCAAAKGSFKSDAITGTAQLTEALCGSGQCQAIPGEVPLSDPIMRVVLTWGRDPSDLDSHLVGSGVHIWFQDMGSLTQSPFIALDTDDVTSYGPEITTAMPRAADGKYCFFVNKYAGAGDITQESTDINGQPKRATVTVEGRGVGQTVQIPDTNPEEYRNWRIFTFEIADGAIAAGSLVLVNDLVADEPGDCNWQ